MEEESRLIWERIRAGEWERAVLEAADERRLLPFRPALLLQSRGGGCEGGDCGDSGRGLARLLGLPGGEAAEAALTADWATVRRQLKEASAQRRKAGDTATWTAPDGMGQQWEAADPTQRLALLLGSLTGLAQALESAAQTPGRGSSKSPLAQGPQRLELLSNELYRGPAAESLVVALAEAGSVWALELARLTDTLLHLRKGDAALLRIAQNLPHLFAKLLKALLDGWTEREPDWLEAQRRRVIVSLLDLCPSSRLPCLHSLLETRRMRTFLVDQALRLPLLVGVEFLLKALEQKPSAGRDSGPSFPQGLQRLHKEGRAPEMGAFLGGLRSWLCEAASSRRAEELGGLLQLLVALRTEAGIQLEGETGRAALAFLCAADGRWEGEGLETQRVATLLALPHLPGGSAEAEGQLVAALERVRDSEDEEAAELLLLAALLFRTNQVQRLPSLLSSVLGRTLPPGSAAYTRLGVLFRAGLYPESLVAAQVSKVPVTAGLNRANTAPFLPVHCVLSLLSTRSFTKHGISIEGWVGRQVEEAAGEGGVHPALVELLEAYARSVVLPLSGDAAGNEPNAPISAKLLRKVFPDPASLLSAADVTVPVLWAFYLLSFRHLLTQESRKILESGGQPPADYPEELWEAIPLRLLCLRIKAQSEHFSALYPVFTKHMINQFPYLLPEGSLARCLKVSEPSFTVSAAELEEALAKAASEPSLCMGVLQRLGRIPAGLIRPFVRGVGRMAEAGVPRSLRCLYKERWLVLATDLPRLVYGHTRAALLGTASTSFALVVDDPLAVLAAEAGAMRTPELVEMVLRVLEVGLEASRVELERSLASVPPLPAPHIPSSGPGMGPQGQLPADPPADTAAQVAALLQAQESAAVHILLELALRDSEGGDGPASPSQREIQSLVCAHIHQIIIRRPLVLKLVLFQGLGPAEVELLGRGVPSLHIALDVVGELLGQAGTTERRLAVALLGELSRHFPIPKALAVGKLVFASLATLVVHLPPEGALELLAPPLPDTLSDVAARFPPLKPQLLRLQLLLASLHASQPKPFLKRSRPALPHPVKLPKLPH